MKILFVFRNSVYFRHYENVVRMLADRGHQLHLVFNSIKAVYPETAVGEVVRSYPSISYRIAPPRVWFWQRVVNLIRVSQTYLRYLQPYHRDAVKYRARARSVTPAPARWLLCGLCDQNESRIWRAIRFLRFLERAIPPDPLFARLFDEIEPELVLVTPVVDLHASQIDWFKCARLKGIPSAVCVASWDNLTTKSFLQMEPDAVIVWNEVQRDEVEKLHRIPAAKVVVTGAQCFDRLFAHRPSMSRDAFLRQAGLPEGCDYLLYLCSSSFIAPEEVGFIREWLARLRAAAPELREIGVLVRPHPQHAEQWKGVDLSSFGKVAVFPREGENPVRGRSFDIFHDSMYYSLATVGINTSMMIESGILGKPVFTIVSSGFQATQDECLHFHYLANGGLLHVGNGLDEHFRQLTDVLKAGESQEEALRDFVRSFVRPNGLDVECTPLVVEAIEKLAAGDSVLSFRRHPATPIILAILWPAALLSYLRAKLSVEWKRLRGARGAEPAKKEETKASGVQTESPAKAPVEGTNSDVS